jgi:DNA-binding protein HU-beta
MPRGESNPVIAFILAFIARRFIQLKKPDMVEQVVESTGHRKRVVTEVLDAAIEVITEELQKHQKVQLAGLGIFEPRKRKARRGTDPRTQEELKLPSTWSLVFRPSVSLRIAITGKHPRDRRSRG